MNFEKLKEYDTTLKDRASILQREYNYTKDYTVRFRGVILKCIVSGKTDKNSISLSTVTIGNKIVDGTVTWEVINIGDNWCTKKDIIKYSLIL